MFTTLQDFPKFKGCNTLSHLLKLLKGAYGVKDAPLLWTKRLEKFFVLKKGEAVFSGLFYVVVVLIDLVTFCIV